MAKNFMVEHFDFVSSLPAVKKARKNEPYMHRDPIEAGFGTYDYKFWAVRSHFPGNMRKLRVIGDFTAPEKRTIARLICAWEDAKHSRGGQ